MAVPVEAGPPRRVCRGGCFVNWSPDGTSISRSNGPREPARADRGDSDTPGRDISESSTL